MDLTEEEIATIGKILSTKSPIVVQRKLAGRSGAGVWLVDAQLPDWSGSAILKVEHLSAIVGRAPEPVAHDAAVRVNARFARAHIAELVARGATREEQISVFSAVAGGLENCRSLRSLPSSLHKAACELVSEDLLRIWNDSAVEAPSLWSESRVIQAWLQNRLYATQGGRIPDRLNAYGIDNSVRSFSYGGNVYPNPGYWALANNLTHDHGIRPILGHCHNDLHGDNVLVTEAIGNRITYFLIDFALADGDEPLFFDQAYLELSSLLATCDKLSINLWIEEITKLNGVAGLPDLYSCQVDKHRIPIAESIAGIRHICESWAKAKYEPRRAQLHRQQILARVAVGLNFFNKYGIEKDVELKALLYASINLKAYFGYCNLPVPDSDCVLREPAISPGISSEEIRNAGHFLDSFERGRSLYVLVSAMKSPELFNLDASVTANPQWALIVDLSEDSERGSVYEKLSPQIGKGAVVRVHLADKADRTNATVRSTTWLKARGWNKVPGSVMPDVSTWRRKKLNLVRLAMSEVFEAWGPMAIRMVVLQGASWDEYTAAICEAVYETAGIEDIRLLWLGPHCSPRYIPKEAVLHFAEKPVERLQATIELSLGRSADASELRLPCRKHGEVSGTEMRDFSASRDISIICEQLELIHSGLADTEVGPCQGEFLRGAPISWAELGLEQDLERDVYTESEKNLKRALGDPRNKMFEIIHKPGAGGTTLARRLLWNLRSLYPTAILRGIDPLTATRVETLFHLTSLPVLLLAEADVCTREDVIRLLHGASSRNVRCCVQFVSRLTGSPPAHPITESHTFVSDVMLPNEAKRFLGRYSIGASTRQINRLRDLASNPQLQRFRSPFFFGLYRFENEFLHVSDYVKAQLHDLDDRQKRLLAYVSLVSVFTQGGLPEKVLALLTGEKHVPGVMIGRVFGHDVDRLLVSYEKDEPLVKASHPLLGQQSLEISLGVRRSDDPDKWRAHLSMLSQRLIEEISDHAESVGPDMVDMLMQLFIQRDHLSADSDKRNLFSPLLIEIRDEAYQAQILRLLTNVLPDEPHFWNHFARHCMYSESRRFSDAIEYLNRAIELAPDDELHQHTLGMAYALRVRETLKEYSRASSQHVAAWHAIESDYLVARACFRKARGLSINASQYPFVSDIQLVTRTISALRSISGASSFVDFLVEETEISNALRDELASANDLLAEVKQLTDETADHPEYVEAVDFYLKKIEQSTESLITYLDKRIDEPGGDTPQNRRFLLSLNQDQRRRGVIYVSPESVERYLRLAEKNLDSAFPTDQDFRHWLSIYRDSKGFNMIEAMDKVTRWHQLTESIDSAFYLYVLNFAQWYDGAITNVDVVTTAIERCVSLSQERNRRRSIEYLTTSQGGIGVIPAELLGERDSATGFFVETKELALVDGVISRIGGPQSGMISVIPLWAKTGAGASASVNTISAFFVPSEDFHIAADENTAVQFFVGFRRGGLRAHVVKRAI